MIPIRPAEVKEKKAQNSGVQVTLADNHALTTDEAIAIVTPLSTTGSMNKMTGTYYYADFRLQRALPKFRDLPLPGDERWEALLSGQKQDLLNQSLKPCYFFESGRRKLHPECRPTEDGRYPALLAYNSLEGIERTWCGKAIRPLAFLTMAEGCDEPVKVFPHDSPPVSGDVMPPIRVLLQSNVAGKLQKLDTCSVKCEVTADRCEDSNASKSPPQEVETIDCLASMTDWTIGDTNWNFKIYRWSNDMKFNRVAYRSSSFYAAQSLKADVPLSTFRADRDGGVPSPAIDFDVADKAISFLDNTRCKGHPQVSSWLETLRERATLASYGNCISTAPLPLGISLGNDSHRMILLKKHLFNFIAEDSLSNEYTSSALWDALHAGVIPVYLGSNNVSHFVPPNSIVSVSAIGTKERTADLIVAIGSNKTLWESYHEWRKKPFPNDLKQLFEQVPTENLLCRICMWAYSKRFGLAWNHRTQRIEAPAIARDNLCFSSDGFVLHPFRESWVISSASGSEIILAPTETECSKVVNMTQIFHWNDMLSLKRRVSQHDSIVDFIIPELKSKNVQVVLRLEVPIENWEGAHFRDVHQVIASHHVSSHRSVAIQDRKSRMTVLADWPTHLRSTMPGLVELVVENAAVDKMQPNDGRRVRIILEDLSTLRDVKTEYTETPFSRPLIHDFLDPLELFFVAPL